MQTLFFTLLAITGAIALSACTQTKEPTSLAPGHYEKSAMEVDEYGTKVTQKKTTDVMVDQYGNKTAIVSQKTTTDPKGLFNKSTSQSTRVYEED